MKIDRGVCVVPGSGQRTNMVDHIERRRDDGANMIGQHVIAFATTMIARSTRCRTAAAAMAADLL
jgi:hypothetical protein